MSDRTIDRGAQAAHVRVEFLLPFKQFRRPPHLRDPPVSAEAAQPPLRPLPIRPRPASGESTASYIRRLAVANHLRPMHLRRYLTDPGPDWIGKGKLRHALNLRARVTGSVPCERDVRGRLFAFYDWCARNDDIPELLSLAKTVSKWENEIIAAVLTGTTNSASESLNRLAKLEARLAYGLRTPASQRRRVRIACTRGTRRRSHAATARKIRMVTGRKPDPG